MRYKLGLSSLDTNQDTVSRNQWDSRKPPLAVKRFVQQSLSERPSTAMVSATDLLLAAYGAMESTSLPILVQRLCDLCNVDLLGRYPKADNRISYSNDKRRCGPTGSISFNRPRPAIRIPQNVSSAVARVSIAHELGHLIIHRRGKSYDEATIRLPSTPEEESLAEYCARLLLMPSFAWSPTTEENLAEYALRQSSSTRVTLHSAVSRLSDPDVSSRGVCGAILWRINPQASQSESIEARLTPYWHLCGDAFVPVGRCRARMGSVVAELGLVDATQAASRAEDVRIGTFVGTFRVDAIGWGSVKDGTRVVLSVFVKL